jgi:galactose-1-phosphate uridylyltransferase
VNAVENRGAVLIEELLHFALHNQLIEESDVIYVRNQLMDFLGIKEPVDNPDELLNGTDVPEYATPILEKILDYCHEKGILK